MYLKSYIGRMSYMSYRPTLMHVSMNSSSDITPSWSVSIFCSKHVATIDYTSQDYYLDYFVQSVRAFCWTASISKLYMPMLLVSNSRLRGLKVSGLQASNTAYSMIEFCKAIKNKTTTESV